MNPDTQKHQQALAMIQNLMRQAQFVQAIEKSNLLLEEKLDDLDVLYFRAVCERKLGDHLKALKSLDSLLDKEPEYGRAHQERGYNFQALDEAVEAIAAFKQAVTINPTLIASWRALSSDTSYPERELAGRHVERLSAMPPELVSVSSFMYQNKLHKAEHLCRAFLKRHPRHTEAMRLLAEIALKFNILDDAEYLLESALSFKPDFSHARYDYAQILHKRQKFHASLAQAEILYQQDPSNPASIINLGNAKQATGDFDGAIAAYDTILKHNDRLHTVHVARGHALKTVGRTDEAIAAYQAGYKTKPDHGDAFWSLANLKTYRFSDDEIAAMQAHEADLATNDVDRAALCFALGKAFEDKADYDQAFGYYERGNALKREENKYHKERLEADLKYQSDHFDAAFFEKRNSYGCTAPDPIFIVGLPRAGSTLLEQILASHSMVDGTMELASIISIAHRFNARQKRDEEPNYPKILNDLTASQLEKLGEQYIEETRHHRSSSPFFIDKMPNNFRHIALIQLILPNAKIIDARRHPLACCFSGYKQLFAEGQEFSYGLEDVGHYYRNYVDVMDHWDRALPGKVLKVQHEDVIDDLEGQVKRILDYCGLPFEQGCIDFHKTKRAVRTPSSEQVRQPIYQSGMAVWKNFEPHLGPLKEALDSLV